MGRTGDGIKKAHIAVGLTFTVIRDSGNLTGEYCIIKQNRQVTKPFIREFFQEARFHYDTEVIAGDVIQTSDGRHFIVMNLIPSALINEVIENEVVLYKCNVSGQIMRFSGESDWNDDYDLQHPMVVIRENAYALMTEALFGNDLESDEELGHIGLKNSELYIPGTYGIQVHDRYNAISGQEQYMVNTLSKRKYDNVNVALVGEDNRP